MFTTLLLVLCGFMAHAWKTDGVLPAKARFATYAGKFCFDYVPASAASEEIVGDVVRDLFNVCEVSLLTQMSEHSCVLGESYGCVMNAKDSMWVSHGCRGDFSVNGKPLTCDSWNEQYSTCRVPVTPTSGYLEVEVRGQMLEEKSNLSASQGQMFLMLFDDEADYWKQVKANWKDLTCSEFKTLAKGVYPLSSELTHPPYVVRHVIRIRERLRPRFWHFAFVNCGAKNVLTPLTYSLHARNIRQGADAEFGIDSHKAVPWEAFFAFVFSMVALCGFCWARKRLSLSPFLVLLCASAACSSVGCILLLVHHRIYAVNGRGCILAGAAGLVCSCLSKTFLTLLQFLIARGWALFLAPEDRSKLVFLVAGLLAVVGVTVGCEVYDWSIRDASTDLYLYESWHGVLILTVNGCLLIFAWLLTWQTIQHESSYDVRMFYFRVSVAAGIYFASLPLVCILVRLLAPWVRQRYVERVELIVRFVSTALLLLQLRPTHLDFTISARMKTRTSALIENYDNIAAVVENSQAPRCGQLADLSDEEASICAKDMGYEDSFLVQ